jgi:hypothetical protein
MSIKKITLPLEKNKYVLTKEAVQVLRQASYIQVSFEMKNNQRVERNCWMCVGVKVKVGSLEAETVFEMPINIFGAHSLSGDWSFCHKEEISATYALHPLQRLAKEGAILEFEPGEDNLSTIQLQGLDMAGDALYWNLKTGKDRIRNYFATSVTSYDSLGRLIQRPNRLPVKK